MQGASQRIMGPSVISHSDSIGARSKSNGFSARLACGIPAMFDAVKLVPHVSKDVATLFMRLRAYGSGSQWQPKRVATCYNI